LRILGTKYYFYLKYYWVEALVLFYRYHDQITKRANNSSLIINNLVVMFRGKE